MRRAPWTAAASSGRLALLSAALLCTGAAAAAAPGEAGAQAAPVGITHFVEPVFPAGLRGVKQGDGHVVLALTVGADGAVLDCLALEASHEEYAAAAVRAVRAWTLAPAVAASRPRREVLQFEFRRTGVVTSLAHAEAIAESFTVPREDGALRTVSWDALPAPPRRLSGSVPRLSPQAATQLRQSPVTVSFMIDREGAARLATVGRTPSAAVT